MSRGQNRWLALALVAITAGLVVDPRFGPLAMGVVTYPFSETFVNQTIGLEAAPLLVVRGVSR